MPWRKVMASGVKVRALVAAVTVWSVLTQNTAAVYARSRVADPRIPEVVSTGGRVLALNGAGVGTKILIHVYLIGLYLEKKTTDARAAIATDEAKRISVIMLRNVSRQQFVDAVEKGMVRNSGLPMPTLRFSTQSFGASAAGPQERGHA